MSTQENHSDMINDEDGMFLKDKVENSEYRPFTLKKWNALAIWAWDVECDTCAICRVHLMEECLKCQSEPNSKCFVVWGDCNHSFHHCCMSQWVRQNNRCPLCQQDWVVQRTGN